MHQKRPWNHCSSPPAGQLSHVRATDRFIDLRFSRSLRADMSATQTRSRHYVPTSSRTRARYQTAGAEIRGGVPLGSGPWRRVLARECCQRGVTAAVVVTVPPPPARAQRAASPLAPLFHGARRLPPPPLCTALLLCARSIATRLHSTGVLHRGGSGGFSIFAPSSSAPGGGAAPRLPVLGGVVCVTSLQGTF